MDTLVIALGGNALLQRGEKPSFHVQMKNAMTTARSIAKTLANEDSFVITHGNGPQVGDELLRNMFARSRIPQLPLHIINAETQAVIGSILQTAIESELMRIKSRARLCTLLTHVIVDKKDSAFNHPTKPIGPFYTKSELHAEQRREKFKYVIEEGAYRRVVASPRPMRIVEINQIKALLKEGFGVICCGGGGIPIFNDWTGAHAVIDKDLTTQLLANSIEARRMAILTSADYVYADYGKESTKIRHANAAQIKKLMKKFDQDTILPKMEACVNFIGHGGKTAYVGNLLSLDAVLKGKSGTRISR